MLDGIKNFKSNIVSQILYNILKNNQLVIYVSKKNFHLKIKYNTNKDYI